MSVSLASMDSIAHFLGSLTDRPGAAYIEKNECTEGLGAMTLKLEAGYHEAGHFVATKFSKFHEFLGGVRAFPFIHEAYPAALKKFQHSSGVKRSQISPMASMS